MVPVLNSLTLYARDTKRSAAFYATYFGFTTTGEIVEGLITLTAPEGGASLFIHQAAKSVKLGQVGVKLVFAVPDVEAFKASSARLGLEFGSTHQANGYAFANAKDPDGNSVCISSRAYRAG
jgi:predicted enzyme related to lactoylglutathione lyase